MSNPPTIRYTFRCTGGKCKGKRVLTEAPVEEVMCDCARLMYLDKTEVVRPKGKGKK